MDSVTGRTGTIEQPHYALRPPPKYIGNIAIIKAKKVILSVGYIQYQLLQSMTGRHVLLGIMRRTRDRQP